MYRVYQNIEINGKDYGDVEGKKYSKFYNEGKWHNFIEPLLPKDCTDMTFIEFGCSSGLYLKMATEKGFKRVIGIEQSENEARMANKYKRSLGLKYKIINETVNEKFNFSQLPVADVVLMSNFHYHLYIGDFIALLDYLTYKTRVCIIVSEERIIKYWKGRRVVSKVREYFKDWTEIGYIPLIPIGNDPTPRKLYSIAFESKLKRIPINEIYQHSGEKVNYTKTIRYFFRRSIKYIAYKARNSLYYAITLKRRRRKWSQQKIYDFIDGKKELSFDIARNGLKKPLLIHKSNGKNILYDGYHRIGILNELGDKTVIVRYI